MIDFSMDAATMSSIVKLLKDLKHVHVFILAYKENDHRATQVFIYIYIYMHNELVEVSGPCFITQLSGFDGAVVSVYDTQSKDSWFKPSKLLNQKLMN